MSLFGNMSYYNNHYSFFGLIIPFMLVDLLLRGYALWKSAKKGQPVWFIALLIVNSMGILPLIYLVINRDQNESPKKIKKSK